MPEINNVQGREVIAQGREVIAEGSPKSSMWGSLRKSLKE